MSCGIEPLTSGPQNSDFKLSIPAIIFFEMQFDTEFLFPNGSDLLKNSSQCRLRSANLLHNVECVQYAWYIFY